MQIKEGMREGVDYILVTKDVIDALIKKYSTLDRDPLDYYKRIGVKQADGEVVCEVKLRRINFFALPNKTTFKMKQALFCYAPKSMTAGDLEKKLLRVLNYYLYTVRKERSLMISKGRLWVTSEGKFEDLDAIDSKHRNYTSAKVKATPVTVTEA